MAHNCVTSHLYSYLSTPFDICQLYTLVTTLFAPLSPQNLLKLLFYSWTLTFRLFLLYSPEYDKNNYFIYVLLTRILTQNFSSIL